MATKSDLKRWLVEALREAGGESDIVGVAKHVWKNHGDELAESGDLFFRWHYDMRWAALELRKDGVLAPVDGSRRKPWKLAGGERMGLDTPSV